MIEEDEDIDEADEGEDFTVDEYRAIQHLGDALTAVVRRFQQRHPTIFVDLRMGTSRFQRPQQLTFCDLLPPRSA